MTLVEEDTRLEHYQNADGANAVENTARSIQEYLNDYEALKTELSPPQNAALIADTIAAMNRQLADAHINETVANVRDSAQKYQTAIQLQKTGEHISQVQNTLLQRNKKILANLSADTMTAKRVATINQQHSIQARVATEYLQLCSIFVGISILIMFVFTLAPVRSFFKHSFAVMQIIVALLFGILGIIVVVRLIANRNHYNMLYQERVFPNYDNRVNKISASQCPVEEEDVEVEEEDVPPVEQETSCAAPITYDETEQQ